MRVYVQGIRIRENPIYPFDDFLLEWLGVKESTLDAFLDDADQPHRVLWMGFVDPGRECIAGLLATNRKDRSYPVVTSAGDTTRIALQDLHRDAKELNFFVYSRPLKAMVYQYRHGSLGPHGFVDLLKSRYNKAKQAAGKEDWERKKEYQGALRYSVVTRKASLDELIANMEQGEIVAVEANDGRAPPSITQKKTVWHFSNKKVPDYSLGGWVRYIRQQFLKVSVQGTDRAGQRQTINVEDEIQTRLALLEMEHEDWMGMMEGAQFRSESFPKDAGTTHLLLPIRKLMEVLIDHAATLRPPG